MKNTLLFFFIIYSTFSIGQTPGEWTWMNGPSLSTQYQADFGIQGVPSPTNHPSAIYEACEWTDLQGNFWLYGGSSGGCLSDLWKFDPLTNCWTWMHGPGTPNHNPNYGIKGIASPLNQPPMTGYGTRNWTDLNGDLWLFGGIINFNGTLNSLWKFNIASNMWTWMGGDTVSTFASIYGLQGVPSVNNYPGYRYESTLTWVDNLGNLWMYGNGSDNVLWKYDIATNEWTWMQGSIAGTLPVYGIKQIPDPLNTPGFRNSYAKWKDLQDNFWFFGGFDFHWSSGFYNDMWKYSISTNEWTWMSGTNLINDSGFYSGKCFEDPTICPSSRFENKSSWTDSCGRFWMFGGCIGVPHPSKNDLWRFDPATNNWMWVSGDSIYNQPGWYGIQGVSDPLNMPPSREGECTWIDLQGNLWMFGGMNNYANIPGNIWRYVPDYCCGGCKYQPTLNVGTSVTTICPGSCISFTADDCNGSSFSWLFPGAIPDTGSGANPQNICYSNPGNFDVLLIATNINGNDTMLMQNYITVYLLPPPQSITTNGDTLVAISGNGSYQWYYNGNLISGATDFYYIASASGDYNVVVIDSNGCEVEAVIYNVIANVRSLNDNEYISVFPNPVKDLLSLNNFKMEINMVSIYNTLGDLMCAIQYHSANTQSANFDVSYLNPGIYFLEVTTSKHTYRTKFVKY